MIKLKNIKIIAFDVGDTIQQVYEPEYLNKCYEAEIKILKEAGLKFTEKDYYLAAEEAWRESQEPQYINDYLAVPKILIKKLGYSIDNNLITKMGNSFMEVTNKYKLKEKRMAPNVIELFKYLNNKGYKLGIISDTKTDWIKGWIKDNNLDNYFYIITLSCEVGGKKASQKPYLEFKKIAKEKYNIKPNEIIMVGDLSVDMDAKKHGFNTILLDPANKKIDHFLYKPDIKIKKLEEIKDIL